MIQDHLAVVTQVVSKMNILNIFKKREYSSKVLKLMHQRDSALDKAEEELYKRCVDAIDKQSKLGLNEGCVYTISDFKTSIRDKVVKKLRKEGFIVHRYIDIIWKIYLPQ